MRNEWIIRRLTLSLFNP